MSDQSPDLPAPGASGATRELPELLRRGRIVATFPDRGVASLVAAVEVMVQEGITSFSFPVGQCEQVSRLRTMYAGRAVFGVHDVMDDAALDQVLAHGPAFVALGRPAPGLAGRCTDHGVPVFVNALTPTEVLAAWQPGVHAVLVVPAEVMGSSYPEALAPLVPGVTLMARGGLGAYSARRWAEAGAAALWLDEALLGDVAGGGSLGGLRERCQTFRQAVDESEG